MTATIADLERLIHQATPRVEDHRSVDRTDIIRRDHGHLNLREVVNSVDALEFTVDSFTRCMKELGKSQAFLDGEGAATASAATAVHGLLRSLEGLCLMTPPSKGALSKAVEEVEAGDPAEEGREGWQEAAAEAKKAGGECFKSKDFAAALRHYSDAIRATPAGDESLSALSSNRSAVLLQLGHANTALADAQRCVELTPEWPKGHFRKGCCLRQLERLDEAIAAFKDGQAVEATNKDWEREVEKTERQHCAIPSTQARQLILHLLPEMLVAWKCSGASSGVLQAQVNGELAAVGTPKWQLIKDRTESAKAQIRYSFNDEKGYMANLAAILQSPPAEGPGFPGAAVVDLNGQPLKIADVKTFISAGSSGGASATFHIEVKHGGKMVAIIGRMPCDEEVRRFIAPHKNPAPPKGSVEGVLQSQARTGFAKALPRFLGFHSYPIGDLNFPVIDLDRDAPDAVVMEK